LQVKALLRRHLPNPLITQTDVGETALLPSRNDRGGHTLSSEAVH
jgi:hypothetical protein